MVIRAGSADFVPRGAAFSYPASPSRLHAKCSGCSCNFPLPTTHVTGSEECRLLLEERTAKNSDWDR